MKMNKKGFTLIEMLVVIAVIAVLVSIVIPTVTSATEKAKLAADAANIRAAVAEVTTDALANGGTVQDRTVNLKSKGDFTVLGDDFTGIAGFTKAEITSIAQAAAGATGDAKGVLTITWDNNQVKINNKGAAVNNPTT